MQSFSMNGLFTQMDYLASKNADETYHQSLNDMIAHHQNILMELQKKSEMIYKKNNPFMEIWFSESESDRCDKMEIRKLRDPDDLSTEWIKIYNSNIHIDPFQWIVNGSVDYLFLSISEENENDSDYHRIKVMTKKREKKIIERPKFCQKLRVVYCESRYTGINEKLMDFENNEHW